MSSKNILTSWKSISEKILNYGPPSTPSKQDIKIIEKYLRKILNKNKNPNILILGCTPAYRKLFAKYNIHVNMADAVKEMHQATAFSLKGIKRKEKFILEDWLRMDLKQSYDLILGDFVVNNIPYGKRDIFFKNIRNHLKNNGSFITRIANYEKSRNTDTILNKYKNLRITKKNLNYLWWEICLIIGFDKKKMKSCTNKGFIALKKAVKKHPYLKKWIKPYEKLFFTGKKDNYLLTKPKQEQQINKYFQTASIEYAKDYNYWENTPTYVLKNED